MFKLVIVEDEDNIRHSLECFIPWSELGFQVVGTFSDGSDALAYLQTNPCDAVLTDLLMSRMSGLELIQNLYEIQPHLKVVILSGHSNFAFAQQAIKYQVAHYLVKPVDEDELIAVFKGISQQLTEQMEEQTAAQFQAAALKDLLQKSFFRDLISGHVASEKEMDGYLKLLEQADIGKDCPLLAYAVQLTDVEMSLGERSPESISADEILCSQLTVADGSCHSFLLEERGNRWRVIFVGTPNCNCAELRKHCNKQMQQLTAALNDAEEGEFVSYLTHSVARLSELLPEPEVTFEKPRQTQVDGNLCESVISDYRLLIVELDLGSNDTLVHLLNGVLYRLKDVPLEDMQFVLKNLYAVVELEYKKRKCNVWDITNGKFNFNHLYRAKNPDDVAACLKDDFCTLCDGLKGLKQGSKHGVVGRLVEHINEHMDEDITHNTIAAKYRVHPGYLSRLFKQEMGETLSEYMLRIRVEQAAKLLKEGQYKIGDVAGMVGYSASSYFSIMFKKYTGHSPREYIQRVTL